MLVSAVIMIEPTENLAEAGREVHAWFLSLVAGIDPHLATRLHDTRGPKPFTTALRHDDDGRAWLRVTTLAWDVSAALLAALTALPDTMTLAGHSCRVCGTAIEQAAHPWAGHDTYEELAGRWQHNDPADWLRLEFATPTSFHSRRLHVPLPVPHLLVESWLGRWNAFSRMPLDRQLVAYAEATLAVSRFSLRTRPASAGRAPLGGMVGRCDLRATERALDKLRQLHLLAAYSFYCGTGHWTTMGLGQTRVRATPGTGGGRSHG